MSHLIPSFLANVYNRTLNGLAIVPQDHLSLWRSILSSDSDFNEEYLLLPPPFIFPLLVRRMFK